MICHFHNYHLCTLAKFFLHCSLFGFSTQLDAPSPKWTVDAVLKLTITKSRSNLIVAHDLRFSILPMNLTFKSAAQSHQPRLNTSRNVSRATSGILLPISIRRLICLICCKKWRHQQLLVGREI